jgi:DNA-binding GntR family transcriptional regulator
MNERERFNTARQSDEDRQTSARRAYNLVREGIREGTIKTGDRLVEDELSVALASSRNAVREALRMLTDEGLITRQRRLGTVVARGLIDVDIKPLLSTTPSPWLPEGLPVATAGRVERRLVPTTPYLRHVLQTDAPQVVMVEDVVSNTSELVSLRIGYYVDDANVGSDDDREVGVEAWRSDLDREHWWLLRDHAVAFERRFGRPFGHSQTSFEATAADAKSRRLLRLPEGVPILLMKSLLVDCDGRPRELSYFHYAGNLVTVSVNAVESVNVDVAQPQPSSGHNLPHAS